MAFRVKGYVGWILKDEEEFFQKGSLGRTIICQSAETRMAGETASISESCWLCAWGLSLVMNE